MINSGPIFLMAVMAGLIAKSTNQIDQVVSEIFANLDQGAEHGPTVVIGITENPQVTELARGREIEGVVNEKEILVVVDLGFVASSKVGEGSS
jgi:hypothetical protein